MRINSDEALSTDSLDSSNVDRSVTKQRCVAQRHSTRRGFIADIFISEQKQAIFHLKSKSLNFNVLFIEILQHDCHRVDIDIRKHHGRLMLLT